MRTPKDTLFVVDDDADVRQSVAALAATMHLGCRAFVSAEDFLAAVDPAWSGCLLLDVRLSGISGMELLERLDEIGCMLPAIVISAHADVPTTVRAMRSGALTVLEKPCRPDELGDAIRQALAVNRMRRAAVARRQQVQRRLETLTPREQSVMEQVIAGKPNKLIARDFDISQRTVDRIRASIFRKMGVETAVEVARMVAAVRATEMQLVK